MHAYVLALLQCMKSRLLRLLSRAATCTAQQHNLYARGHRVGRTEVLHLRVTTTLYVDTYDLCSQDVVVTLTSSWTDSPMAVEKEGTILRTDKWGPAT